MIWLYMVVQCILMLINVETEKQWLRKLTISLVVISTAILYRIMRP